MVDIGIASVDETEVADGEGGIGIEECLGIFGAVAQCLGVLAIIESRCFSLFLVDFIVVVGDDSSDDLVNGFHHHFAQHVVGRTEGEDRHDGIGGEGEFAG